jgi:hypothetical protein
MKRICVFLFFILSVVTSAVAALPAEGAAPRGTTLTGTVTDSLLDRPVEYANVVLFQQSTRKQVTGTVTNPSGAL